MPFSGLKAMGVAPKPVESYYEESPIGWSMKPVNYQGSYSNRDWRPYYMDPQQEQQRAMQQMAQQYQFNRLQSEMQNLPQIQQLEDIERQERMKSGLERLEAIKQKQEFQNKLQQGQIDYYTPEGRRQMTQAVGMGVLTPSSLQAIRAASPKAEMLSEAVYNMNMADTPEKLNEIIGQTDKSLHLERDFRDALHAARSKIAQKQSARDFSLIERATREGMPYNEMVKYLNEDMDKISDRGGFMKAYNDFKITEEAKKNIFTPAWRKQDEELLGEVIKRQTSEPSALDLESVLSSMPKNMNRDFTRSPASPEEIQMAYQEWKTAPSKMLNARKKMADDMLNQALGKVPEPQKETSQVSKGEALVNKFTQ